MNYYTFQAHAQQVGIRFAINMARQEGVCTAGIQLWVNRLKREGFPATV